MKHTEGSVTGHTIYHARVDGSGRIVLPAELREALGIDAGDTLIVARDQEGVHLRTREEALRRAQEYFAKLAPESVRMSDELIKERRAEARRE